MNELSGEYNSIVLRARESKPTQEEPVFVQSMHSVWKKYIDESSGVRLVQYTLITRGRTRSRAVFRWNRELNRNGP